MNETIERIRAQLFALQEPDFRTFQQRLLPTLAPETVIGVRTPALRALAKTLSKTPEAAAFLQALPHTYFEENNLHAFLIARIRDFTAAVEAVDTFLPHVNNWATCDQLSPQVFSKYPKQLLVPIGRWLNSTQTYTIRFAIGMLQRHYLDAQFQPAYLELVARTGSDEYYVNMMVAWYFATALAKQPEATLPYLQQRRLPPWTHNKAIQKALESYRISPEQKRYLRTLKYKASNQ